VPLHLGGLPIYNTQTGQGTYYLAIDIPDGLSLLAAYNPNAVIRGLNSFPPQDRPNPLPVHLAFDGMVGSGFFALAIAVIFWFLYFLKKRLVPENKLLLGGVILSGILSFVAVELGWTVTEEGRQPWVIYGVLRTSQAVTTAPFLNISFLVFSCVYIVLAVTMIVLLLRQARRPLPELKWEVVASSEVESGFTSEQQEEHIGV
jgi:cytochrome d ubiquinol oxidase subunit I